MASRAHRLVLPDLDYYLSSLSNISSRSSFPTAFECHLKNFSVLIDLLGVLEKIVPFLPGNYSASAWPGQWSSVS